MWMLSSDESYIHGFLPCVCCCIFMHCRLCLCWSASSLDTSIFIFLALVEMRPLLLISFLRLHHFCFHVGKELLSAARLRTRRDFSY